MSLWGSIRAPIEHVSKSRMKCHYFSKPFRRSVGQGKSKLKSLVALSLLLAAGAWDVRTVHADATRKVDVQEIIGGTDAAASAPPWMVALIANTESADIPIKRLQFCGGVLVSSEWILTAAHCVLRSSVSNTSVILGQGDIEAVGVQQSALSQIVVHPNYNSSTFENDVALLKLETPTQLEPVSLLDESLSVAVAGQAATAFGWGQAYVSPARCEPVFTDSQIDPDEYECRIHDFEKTTREFQGRLLRANLTLLSYVDCNARVRELLQFLEIESEEIDESTNFIPANQFCAYDPNEKKGVCFGDSGGPMLVEQNGKLVLLGTATLVYGSGGCAREFSTDVFTLTSAFSEFMDDVMHRDYALGFESFCPEEVNPLVEYEQVEEATTLTRILWKTAANATNYILRYSLISDEENEISTLVLDGSLTMIDAELEPGTNFYVSVQAENENCTGPVSEVLEVLVPGP